MGYLILFFFGLAIGSFMNVIALRYDGEHDLFDPRVIGGRSRCPHCKRTLRWFELVPLASYLAQGGRCRTCDAAISYKYPLVELVSGAIFVGVPWRLAALGLQSTPLTACWTLAFEAFLLLAYIDLRLGIVPDELTVVLGALAIFEAIFALGYPAAGSFLGAPAAWFAVPGGAWASRIAGALFGGGFFLFLSLATRGKGMGMGDVKLGIPLGFLFGWPDIIALYAAAFVAGAAVGIAYLARGMKSRKSPLPFVPFLALGAVFVVFLGAPFFAWYFGLIGLPK